MDESVENTGDIAVAAEPEAAGQQDVQHETAQEHVPVSALQAERQQRQQLQEQNRLLQEHMALLQANGQKQQQQPDPYEGLSDDDVLTFGEAKKFLGQIQQSYQSSVEELRVQQKYKDYDQVVSEYLPQVIEKNPSLKTTLQNDPNRYELAYFLAKQSDGYREASHKTKKSTDAQRIVENGQRAGNLSAVGGTAPQSQVSNFRNMSDADFMKLANRNMGRF